MNAWWPEALTERERERGENKIIHILGCIFNSNAKRLRKYDNTLVRDADLTKEQYCLVRRSSKKVK
jgi:hypothetical protein